MRLPCHSISKFVNPTSGAIAAQRASLRFPRDPGGTAAVEFAILIPVLTFALIGAFILGLTLNNYIQLTNAAEAGINQLTLSRGDSMPYTSTTNAVKNAALALTPQSSLTITLTVNGSTCSSDSGCQTALTSASGKSANVRVTFPCPFGGLHIGSLSLNIPGCPTSANSTGRIF